MKLTDEQRTTLLRHARLYGKVFYGEDSDGEVEQRAQTLIEFIEALEPENSEAAAPTLRLSVRTVRAQGILGWSERLHVTVEPSHVVQGSLRAWSTSSLAGAVSHREAAERFLTRLLEEQAVEGYALNGLFYVSNSSGESVYEVKPS